MIKQAELKLANLIQILMAAHKALPSVETLTGEDLENELGKYACIFNDVQYGLTDLASYFGKLEALQCEGDLNHFLKNEYKVFDKVRELHSVGDANEPKLMESLK